MAKNNAVNLDITNNADGAQIGGGVTQRILKWLGANITLTGSGSNTYTFPSATDTLVGRASTDTLTNKTIDADNNTLSNIEVDNMKASAIVTESEGIASNDNDTTIPTSAAVKDYVDSKPLVDIGSFNVTANGTIDINCGFEPKAVMFLTAPSTSDYVGSRSNSSMGVGFDDGTTHVGFGTAARIGQGAGSDLMSDRSIGTTTIGLGGSTQGNVFYGRITAKDSSGFTVTIDDYAADATVYFLAFG